MARGTTNGFEIATRTEKLNYLRDAAHNVVSMRRKLAKNQFGSNLLVFCWNDLGIGWQQYCEAIGHCAVA